MYGSVANVRTITSIKPSDVGFDTDKELIDWLQLKMDEIAVSIEKDRNRTDFAAEGWLPVVDGIADRWGAAFVRFVMANRDSPIVRVDDFSVEMPEDDVPGKGIMMSLRKIPRFIDKRFVFESGVVKAAPEDATGF